MDRPDRPHPPPAEERPATAEEPIPGLIVRLCVPVSIGFALLFLFQLADLFWVSRLGTRALAAFGFTFPVTFLLISLTLGLGLGVTAVVSRAIGAGERERARELATHALLLALIAGVAVSLLGLELGGRIFSLLGAPPDLLSTIAGYMTVWFAGFPLLILSLVGSSILRATGDTRTPAMISIFAGVLNIGVEPLLIFGIGPWPRLDLPGAAATAALSWLLSLSLILRVLRRRELHASLRGHTLAAVAASFRRILVIGAPAALAEGLTLVADGMVTRVLAGQGPHAVAAVSVASRIELFSLSLLYGLAGGITPFIGQSFGARRFDRLRAGYRYAARLSAGSSLVVALALGLLSAPLSRIFTHEPAVLHGIALYLMVMPASAVLHGASLISKSALGAMHLPWIALGLTVLRLFVIGLPLAWLGAKLHGLPGILIALTSARAMSGALSARVQSHALDRFEAPLPRPAPGGAGT
jgi:putative MATE family efflux protein